MEERFIPELARKAKAMIDNGQDLAEFRATRGMCACMGPDKGEYLCPCAQNLVLEQKTVDIVGSFDEDEAKRIWMQKFAATLPG